MHLDNAPLHNERSPNSKSAQTKVETMPPYDLNWYFSTQV